MRLGLNTGYVGSDGTAGTALALALEAERLGYDSLWVPEPYGNDAATALGWLAGQTERILLGTGILAIPGRTPAMCAQTAATLDLISGGRLLLGLGTSGPQVSEGWHGVPFARQLARTREYVDVVRMALRRERVEYHGETIDLPLEGGEGKPLKLLLRPPRAEVPVYLAALGPRNVALCGELADGWLPFLWAPEHAAELREPLDEGALAAGRAPGAVAVCPTAFLSVSDDLESARDAVRPMLALYVGGMGSRTRNFYNRMISSYGFDDVAQQVQELYLAGRRQEAASALPDELIDMVTLCGPVDRVADRLSAYREAGATTVIVFPVGSAEGRLEQVREFARAADRSGQVEAWAGRT
jgi:F420-dependent oxidoreductase-like protein